MPPKQQKPAPSPPQQQQQQQQQNAFPSAAPAGQQQPQLPAPKSSGGGNANRGGKSGGGGSGNRAVVMSTKAGKQKQQQQHADGSGSGAAAAEDSTKFSAGAGVDVVSWLAKKTGMASSGGGGAIAYLNQVAGGNNNNAKPTPAAGGKGGSAAGKSGAPVTPPQQPSIPQPASKQQQQQQQQKADEGTTRRRPQQGQPQGQQQQQQQQGSSKGGRQGAGQGGSQQAPQPRSSHQPQSKHADPTSQQQQQQSLNGADAAAEQQQQQLQQQMGGAPVFPANMSVEEQQQLMIAQATHEAIVTAIQQQDQQPGKIPSLDLPSLLEVIDDHQITIVCTDTGTGKSSQLPSALLDANLNNRIVSSQPRRTATMAIAGHVANLRGERVGDTVGYWIRGAKAGDEGTRLWYLTSYTLLLQLLARPDVPYTHVILDEFHERQPDLEVTMALLKLALRKGSKIKVILVSATMDIGDWQSYLEGFDVAVFRQTETEHRVHSFNLEQICPVIGMAAPRPTQLTFAENTIVENTIFVAQYLLAYLNSWCQPHHAAIVFLPGRAHVEQFCMWIESQMHQRMTAIPWHSGVELNTITAAIKRPAGHRQKIYVATDIAEVSITIPDLVFAIDLCLVKRPQLNVHQEASVMFPPLSTQYVSKSNVAQRRGRVGRTQQGFYFSMLPSDLEAELPDHAPAPIVNSRIDELALHVLQVVQNPVALFGLCCSQPTIEAIRTSMRTLGDAGLIVASDDATHKRNASEWNEPILNEAEQFLQQGARIDRYSPTFVGKLAQVLPVSVSQSLLVFYGFLTGLESLMVLAGACANLPLPFVAAAPSLGPGGGGRGGRNGGRGGNNNRGPRDIARDAAMSVGRAMELAELSMKEHSRDAASDVISSMGLVLAFPAEIAEGASEAAINEWCSRNSASRERIQAIVDLEDHIKYELGAFVPFRDVDDHALLARQLTELKDVVRAMIGTAFASQALEVTADSSARFKVREGAQGVFTDLHAVPDLHTPSSIRWEVGAVVIPVTLSLRHSHLLGSFTTVVKDLKTFYLSCLLFAHRLSYEIFEDDDGQYYEFVLQFHGRSRAIEADAATGQGIIEFRQHLEAICNSLEEAHDAHASHKAPDEAAVNAMNVRQRQVVAALTGFFFGSGFENLQLTEIQQGDEVIGRLSALTR